MPKFKSLLYIKDYQYILIYICKKIFHFIQMQICGCFERVCLKMQPACTAVRQSFPDKILPKMSSKPLIYRFELSPAQVQKVLLQTFKLNPLTVYLLRQLIADFKTNILSLNIDSFHISLKPSTYIFWQQQICLQLANYVSTSLLIHGNYF